MGGYEERRKISWVKWDVECKSKEKGELEARDIIKFNRAILGKWRWRL